MTPEKAYFIGLICAPACGQLLGIKTLWRKYTLKLMGPNALMMSIPKITAAVGCFVLLQFATPAETNAQDAQSSAAAPTISERLKALESKTGFYRTTTKKIQQTLKKAETATQGTFECVANQLRFTINPGIVTGGTSYAWATLQTTYAAGEPLKSIQIGWKTNRATFGKSVNLNGASNGVAVFKDFGMSDMFTREIFTFEVDVYSKSGNVPACDVIQKVDVQLKLVNVEVIEPK